MGKAAFEIHAKDGRAWKIYVDGRTEGFPEGSVIFNRIPLQVRSGSFAESCPTKSPANEGLAQT